MVALRMRERDLKTGVDHPIERMGKCRSYQAPRPHPKQSPDEPVRKVHEQVSRVEPQVTHGKHQRGQQNGTPSAGARFDSTLQVASVDALLEDGRLFAITSAARRREIENCPTISK